MPAPQQPLLSMTFDQLGDVGHGAARAAINSALRTIYRDLDDRGEDNKDRVLILQFKFEKLDSGDVAVHFEGGPKVPVYRTGSTIGRIEIGPDNQPRLLFALHSQDNPRQRTIHQEFGTDPEEDTN